MSDTAIDRMREKAQNEETCFALSDLLSVQSKELAAAQREIDDLKDLANGLIAYAREMLPICPEKARKMLEYATEKGREMRSNARAEIEMLKKRLGEARDAISTLPQDCFGLGGGNGPTYWYIRDELLANIEAALAGARQEDGE